MNLGTEHTFTCTPPGKYKYRKPVSVSNYAPNNSLLHVATDNLHRYLTIQPGGGFSGEGQRYYSTRAVPLNGAYEEGGQKVNCLRDRCIPNLGSI